MLKMAFGLLTILVPLQIELGDLHGLNTREHQPVKIAAIEANWDTQARMPLLLFAWPDERAEANRFEVGIPVLGSIILTHDCDGVVQGLKDWKPEDRPPVAIPFFAFRIMVGIGVAMLALVVCSWWVLAQEATRRRALVPEAVRVGISARFRRGGCRMGHDGGRAPALGGVRPRPHPRRRHAFAGAGRMSRCRSRSTLSRTSSSSARAAISSCACCGPARRQATGEWPAAGGNTRATTLRGGGRRVNTCPALDLVPLWAGVLALGVFMYVLLDGFDLGVGILFPYAPDDAAAT